MAYFESGYVALDYQVEQQGETAAIVTMPYSITEFLYIADDFKYSIYDTFDIAITEFSYDILQAVLTEYSKTYDIPLSILNFERRLYIFPYSVQFGRQNKIVAFCYGSERDVSDAVRIVLNG